MRKKITILTFCFLASIFFVAGSADSSEYKTKQTGSFSIYLFEGEGCPHCAEEKIFLDSIRKKYPRMRVKEFEVWHNRQNAILLAEMAKAYNIQPRGVPVTFIGNKSFIGFSKQIEKELLAAIEECSKSFCPDPSDIMSGILKTRQATSPEKKEQDRIANSPKPKPDATTKKENAEINNTDNQPDKNGSAKKEDPGDITIELPLIGTVRGDSMSLPALTVIIAGLDSFNPCAFFVLFSLLGILVHAHSRAKMLLVGGIFVFFSGLIYFIFMAAWLNIFILLGHVAMITSVAGAISVIIAIINIKDFFWFKEGVSLTISNSAQTKLFDRMRKLIRKSSTPSIIFGAVVLAIAANSYELLCTAGFPMVYTRILTLNNLSSSSYYFYLALYNFIYVIPLAIIVAGLSITLGRRALTEWEGRVLKLVSGFMMLGLGITLIAAPALLNNLIISMLILTAAIGISTIIALLFRKTEKKNK